MSVCGVGMKKKTRCFCKHIINDKRAFTHTESVYTHKYLFYKRVCVKSHVYIWI